MLAPATLPRPWASSSPVHPGTSSTPGISAASIADEVLTALVRLELKSAPLLVQQAYSSTCLCAEVGGMEGSPLRSPPKQKKDASTALVPPPSTWWRTGCQSATPNRAEFTKHGHNLGSQYLLAARGGHGNAGCSDACHIQVTATRRRQQSMHQRQRVPRQSVAACVQQTACHTHPKHTALRAPSAQQPGVHRSVRATPGTSCHVW